MIGLIEKIVNAIATQEGAFAPGDPPPVKYNNPGDLEASPFSNQKSGPFCVFDTKERGIAALYYQVSLMLGRGDTLRQLIYAYSPPNENNTSNLLNELGRRIGLTPAQFDTPLMNFLEVTNIP